MLGIFVGLVLGMLIALAIVWYFRKAPLPFENKYEKTAPAGPTDGSAPKQLPLPGKKGDAESKPRFDFYGILEGKQTAPPPSEAKPVKPPTEESKADAPKPAPVAPVPPAASTERFYLQVGAFQKPAEADNVKAKLTLQGYEAEVVEADIPEKGKMYRVRTGPYTTLDEANKTRHQLAENGMQATMIKTR